MKPKQHFHTIPLFIPLLKFVDELTIQMKDPIRESSFNMTRGMKILRGGSEDFRHSKGGL